jgi:hypothetical protein
MELSTFTNKKKAQKYADSINKELIDIDSEDDMNGGYYDGIISATVTPTILNEYKNT